MVGLPLSVKQEGAGAPNLSKVNREGYQQVVNGLGKNLGGQLWSKHVGNIGG